jgi:hypothetical protein
MNVGALNGRVKALEKRLGPPAKRGACAACGLEHAHPLTIPRLRAIIGVTERSEWPAEWAGRASVPPLCLCEACCGDLRGLAELTHR